MRRLFLAAFALFALCAPVAAQQVAQNPLSTSFNGSLVGARRTPARRLAALRRADAPNGSRVTITSDAPLGDYSARRDGDRFLVLIPQAAAAPFSRALAGRGFKSVEVEQRGEDVLVTFLLEPGATASVRASFNRLDVLLVAAGQQQQDQQQAGGAAAPAPSPTATPPNGPAAVTTAPAAASDPSKTTVPATGPTAEATKEALSPDPSSVPFNLPTGAAALKLPPEKANPVRLVRFDKPPAIDGKLDDEAWKQAAVFKDFYQTQPGDNLAPSQPTVVRMGFDARFLYIAFHAYDEPGKVRATVAKRDDVFNDDYVGVILDTFNDSRKGYELFFNPFGIQADALMNADGNEDTTIDIVMESKGTIVENGWTVEVAIPFKSLRFEAGKDKLWGVHFFRRIKRFNNEQNSWMPLSRGNTSFLGQAGHITGIEGISTERTLEFIPSLTVSETGRRIRSMPNSSARALGVTDQGRFVNKPIEFDPGLTAKLGLTQSITLDLALNPDFAQVEADATVVTANQRFPIFFEEKRPFFLEGKEIFETLISAVHTRTIIDPDVAVKLSGKRGRNSFGIMLASDNAPGNFSEEERTDPDILPGIERFLDKNAYIGVVRLKRDFGKENTIGFLGTTYNFIERHNHMGGFDTRFRFNKTTTLTAQVLASTSRRFFFDPNRGESIYQTGNGMAYAYVLASFDRHWGFEYAGVGRSNRFRADVGFNRRFNTHNQSLFVQYRSEQKPKAKLISWRVFNFMTMNADWQFRSQFFLNESQLQLNFARQSYVGFGVQKGFERVFEEEFGPKRSAPGGGGFAGDDAERSAYKKDIYFFAGSTISKKYSFNVFTIHRWGQLDFDFGAGQKFPRVSPVALAQGQDAPQDPGPGSSLEAEVSFTYQPTDALRSSVLYLKSRLRRYDTGLVAFDDNIITSRTTYQFTRFTFARARVDYSTLGSSLRGQFLVGYTPNPGTAFYVGYNDDLSRNGFNPFSGQIEPGFRRNGRTFFIKASYLIRRSF